MGKHHYLDQTKKQHGICDPLNQGSTDRCQGSRLYSGMMLAYFSVPTSRHMDVDIEAFEVINTNARGEEVEMGTYQFHSP